MSDDNSVWRDTLTTAITKAVKSAKRLGYSGEAFSSMASIAFSSYAAGEQDNRLAEKSGNGKQFLSEEKKP
jgi:hypothetical protein